MDGERRSSIQSVTKENLRRRKGNQLLSRARRLGKIGVTVPLVAHRISTQLSGAGPSPQGTAMALPLLDLSDNLNRCNVEQKALAGISEHLTGHSLYLYFILKPLQNFSSGSGEVLPVVG